MASPSVLGFQYGVELIGEEESGILSNSSTDGGALLQNNNDGDDDDKVLDGAESVLDNGDGDDDNDEDGSDGGAPLSRQEGSAAHSPVVVPDENVVVEVSMEQHAESILPKKKQHGGAWFVPRSNKTMALLLICLLIAAAAIVGGVCGSGLCSKSSNSSSLSSKSTQDDAFSDPNDESNRDGDDSESVSSNDPDPSPNDGNSITDTSNTTTTTSTTTGPNDACERAAGPFNIGGRAAAGTLPDVSSSGSSASTLSPPPPVCFDDNTSNTFSSSNGLWYKVTGGGEVLRASTCVDDEGAYYDFTNSLASSTVVTVYQGDCSSDLQCVVANDRDPSCTTAAVAGSSVSWHAAKGVEYYVLVQGAPGDVALQIDYETNGLCQAALPITTAAVTEGSMRNAGDEFIFTCSLELARGGQKWYSVQAVGGWMRASTCSTSRTFSTDFGARVDVLMLDTNAELEEGTDACVTSLCAGLRDSECQAGLGNQMAWYSEPGQLYYIMVYKTSYRFGSNFALEVTPFEPVVNDDCEAAATIAVDGSSLVTGSTLFATVDADNYAGWGAPPCGATEALHPGVWFQVTATADDLLLASTCVDETNYATEISVYEGSSCDELVCVEATGRQFCNEKASVYWQSAAGTTYWVLVHGAGRGLFPSVGDFGLTVAPFETERNNRCERASLITTAMFGDIIQGSTFASTLDVDVPNCASYVSEAPGIWYRVVGTGRLLRASTCDPSTNFDTQITVYTTGMSSDCQALACISTDDNSCGVQSSVSWSTFSGMTYYILVHGRLESSVGQFALILEEYEPLVPNDFCNAAVVPPVNGTVVVGTTDGATFDNTATCADVPNVAPGVWYMVQGTGTLLTASLCTDETNYETAITVFAGDCVDLDCIAANLVGAGDGCGRKSELSWVTILDRTYYVLVHGYDTRVGEFGLVLDEPEPDITNDYCVSAFFLAPGPDVIFGSTVGASHELTPICSNITQTGPGVWYTVSGTGERMVASTCNSEEEDVPVTSFDTKISVFTGVCGRLECTLADDNYCGSQSRLVWLTEKDVMYFILVHGETTGTFGLVVDDFVPDTTNDFCSSAQGPLLPKGETVFGSTTGSSFDNVEFCGVSNTSPGVWFFVVVCAAIEVNSIDVCFFF